MLTDDTSQQRSTGSYRASVTTRPLSTSSGYYDCGDDACSSSGAPPIAEKRATGAANNCVTISNESCPSLGSKDPIFPKLDSMNMVRILSCPVKSRNTSHIRWKEDPGGNPVFLERTVQRVREALNRGQGCNELG